MGTRGRPIHGRRGKALLGASPRPFRSPLGQPRRLPRAWIGEGGRQAARFERTPAGNWRRAQRGGILPPMNGGYEKRRRRFLREIGRGVAILKTHSVKHRSADQSYVFRANSDFYYLTGLDEPESIAVFAPEQKKKFVIFVRPRDRAREIWDGRRLGPQRARRRLGADAAYPVTDFEKVLPTLLGQSETIYHRFNLDPDFDRNLLRILEAHAAAHRRQGYRLKGILDPTVLTNRMRLIKDPDEIRLLQRAADITAEAHRAALLALRPGLWEYEIDALLNYHYRRNGANGSAYPAIVASGPNACILHYHENNRRLQRGDLVLIDSGAEYRYYACDVTRTWPVSGRFTREQRAIYNIVLAAQESVIRMVRPGLPYPRMHEKTVDVLTRGLKDLGLLRGSLRRLIKKKQYMDFFMHGTGHWLGLDTHDECPYREEGKPVRLQPGMVFTVEPGLYVHEDLAVPRRWKGIGVRIEDDVLVTRGGARVLTRAIPKDPDEIEQLLATRPK